VVFSIKRLRGLACIDGQGAHLAPRPRRFYFSKGFLPS
jgi:hypothetical protein